MTLARNLRLKVLLFGLSLLTLGGASLWGLWGMRVHFDAAADRHERLRTLYEVGYHVAAARELLLGGGGTNQSGAWASLALALRAAEPLRAASQDTREPGAGALRGLLHTLAAAADRAGPAQGPSGHALAALGQVAEAAGQLRESIVANRVAASARLRTTVAAMALLTALSLLAAALIGRSQHRSIVRPLQALHRAVARVAAADFSEPVDDRVGDEELAELARRFNHMSRELHRLYTGLEDEVRLKGQQLARSQRLAGLGFLAAGIAHEINNPLAAMSFYAESAQQRLREATAASPLGSDRHALAGELVARLDKALTVVREEAQRCKLITDRLLALARPGATRRGAVDLHEVARRAIEVAQGMPALAGVRVSLAPHAGPAVLAWADASEMVQVALNLVCNAMEAVEPDTGLVEVSCERVGDWVRMRVGDDGRGMSTQVLERVFEPFFTDKPRRGLTAGSGGTGLGLTVAHAIVEQHGGRLTALSEGPGRGSVFTVELPPASAQASADPAMETRGEGLDAGRRA